LLLGIDDGAKTFEDSLRLTRALQGFGVTDSSLHPYYSNVWDNTHEGIASKKVETIQQLEKKITLQFLSAAEYLMDDQFVRLFNLMIY
jgi:tyrosine-protein phosphatase YwqE